ncbi:MAG: lamin tail domain-containing protein, partial [Bacteroidetes bacterium]|nr:lamin tail domain-containing protein [Bacteroidota bacterium]
SVSTVEGPGIIEGGLSGLSATGDQILAYTGDAANPSFIAAISTNLFLDVCNTTSGGSSNNNTCLPEPLVEGINAIAVPGDVTEADNIFIDFNDFIGSPADILAIIMDPENWTYDDDPDLAGYEVWPDWVFNFITPDPSEISFQTGFLSMDEGAGAATITFSISPAASGSQNMIVSLSGNASTDDFNSNPAFEGNDILINIPTGATSASFSISALADVFTEGVETGTFTITSLSPGLIAGTQNTLNFEINDPEGVSFISFASAEYNANEGSGSLTVTMNIAPAADSDGNFSILISENELSSADYTTTPPANAGVIDAAFLAGATQFSFVINLIDDTEEEGNETMSLSIDGLSAGFNVGQFGTATINISDNDGVIIVTDLYINEVSASNTSTVTDENGEFDDWIEIYNGADVSQDLAGLYITDEVTNTTKHQFPVGDNSTIIEAGGFKLVWADNSPAQGALHTNFTISASGEFVGLYNITGEVIDSISVPALGPDQSYGRTDELSTDWVIFNSGLTTPDASNATSSIELTETVSGKIFPSPANQSFNISISGEAENLNIHVFDLNGRIMFTGNTGSNSLVNIDCSSWSNGIYLVRIGKNNTRTYSKISVVH